MNKETISKIKKLKKKGKNPTEISKLLNIPYSTVQYHYDDEARKRHIAHVKLMQKEKPQKRNKKKNREYQRKYHNRRYKEDEEYREKMKKANREHQRKVYALKKKEKKNE